jgi:uncharacterized protein (DUF427 family)
MASEQQVFGDDARWKEDAEDFVPPPRVEQSPRWVRAVLSGRTVADSKQVMLHVAYGRPIRPGSHKPELPGYFFPIEDVDRSVLMPAGVIDGRRWWHAVVDGERIEHAAWQYDHPSGPFARLEGHLTFAWEVMDAWFEEAEQIFEHARDPQHRVDAIASTRSVEVSHNGRVLASSATPHLVFETGLPVRYYLPADDVDFGLLEPSELVTRCPYKGVARFWSVAGAGSDGQNVAWSYPDPIAENPKIRELVAFYNERLDIDVDGVRIERPRTPWS